MTQADPEEGRNPRAGSALLYVGSVTHCDVLKPRARGGLVAVLWSGDTTMQARVLICVLHGIPYGSHPEEAGRGWAKTIGDDVGDDEYPRIAPTLRRHHEFERNA